jgi:hypothetical protein
LLNPNAPVSGDISANEIYFLKGALGSNSETRLGTITFAGVADDQTTIVTGAEIKVQPVGSYFAGSSAPTSFSISTTAQSETALKPRIFVSETQGHVGINRTDPGVIFDVSGDSRIAGTLYSQTHLPIASYTYDLGSSSAYWRDLYLSTGTIYMGPTGTIGADGSGNMLINKSNGKGLGINTGGFVLPVNTAICASGDIFVGTTTNRMRMTISQADTATYIQTNATNGFRFTPEYSGTTVLSVNPATARVGVNTTTPAVALDVVGAGKFSANVDISGIPAVTALTYNRLTAGVASTITVPSTYSYWNLEYVLWGGGGGGGAGGNNIGGFGNIGGYGGFGGGVSTIVQGTTIVGSNQSINYTVGDGGAGGVNATGAIGGTTTLTLIIQVFTAPGGTGGVQGLSSQFIATAGQDGVDFTNFATGGIGGLVSANNGTNGTFGSGGGGGGGISGIGNGGDGGNGGAGGIFLRLTPYM